MADPANDSWVKVADFPGQTGRSGAVAFVMGNKAYVGTGYNGKDRLKDFWEYDPATNSGTRKADFGGTARLRLRPALPSATTDTLAPDTMATTTATSDIRSRYRPVEPNCQHRCSKRKMPPLSCSTETLCLHRITNGVYQSTFGSSTRLPQPGLKKWHSTTMTTLTIYCSQAVSFALNGKGYIAQAKIQG